MMEMEYQEMDWLCWDPFPYSFLLDLEDGNYEVSTPVSYYDVQNAYEVESDLLAAANQDAMWGNSADFEMGLILQDNMDELNVATMANSNSDPHRFVNDQNVDASTTVAHQSLTNEPTSAFESSDLQSPQLGPSEPATCVVDTTKDSRKRKVHLYDMDINDPHLTKDEINKIKKAKRSKNFHENRKKRLSNAKESFKTSLMKQEQEFQSTLDILAIIQERGRLGEVKPEMLEQLIAIKKCFEKKKKDTERFNLK